MSEETGRATPLELTSTGIALLALVVAIASLVAGERRADRAEQEQHASRVFLSEAPQYFEPTRVHFRDVYARWSRTPQSLPERSGEEMPRTDTDDSPYWMDARNCVS